MKLIVVTLLALVAMAAARSVGFHHGCAFRSEPRIETHVKSPLPHTYLDVAALPANFTWCDNDGVNYCTPIWNQHIPQYCGSCWTMGTSSALSNRIAIARNNVFPTIQIAPQVSVDCVTAGQSMGCQGGDPTAVYAYMLDHGVSDETCAQYQAKNLPCNAYEQCTNCDYDLSSPLKKCYAQPTYRNYTVTEHGLVNGTDAMMAEIYARGPIACGVGVTEAFLNYTGGIFTGPPEPIDHEISLVGWAEMANSNGTMTDVWILQNSWGEPWGVNGGYMFIERGVNAASVETDCDWAVPTKVWNDDGSLKPLY